METVWGEGKGTFWNATKIELSYVPFSVFWTTDRPRRPSPPRQPLKQPDRSPSRCSGREYNYRAVNAYVERIGCGIWERVFGPEPLPHDASSRGVPQPGDRRRTVTSTRLEPLRRTPLSQDRPSA